MSVRIEPLEPLPHFVPLDKRPRLKESRTSKRRQKAPALPPTRMRPGATGEISAELMADHDALLTYLKYWAHVIAIELAHEKKSEGVTASDVRMEGERRGKWLNDQFKRREFSFLSGMFKAAGFQNTGRERLSKIPGTRNENDVWALPMYMQNRGAA